MPFYEYTCSNCGHHHEELQKVTDKPLRKCPECGKSTLSRVMSAPVFRLKGGGWYETDFKSEAERKRNLAGEREEAAKADTAEKPADKAAEVPAKEAKPAAETPAKAEPARKTVAAKPVKAAKPAKAAPRKPAPVRRKPAARSKARR